MKKNTLKIFVSIIVFLTASFAQAQTGSRDASTEQELHLKRAVLPFFNIAMEYYQNEEYEEAYGQFVLLADENVPEIHYYIAHMNELGLGTRTNYNYAIEYYQKASDLGHTASMNKLAEFHLNGLATDIDLEQALSWYHKAIDAGDGNAAYNLGELYMNGEHLPQDRGKAVRLYHQALELGTGKAGLPLGRYYSSPYAPAINMSYAVEMLEYAAKDEDDGENIADAAYFLAQIYLGNSTGIIPSRSESFKWLEIAAKNGHVDAAADVGGRYFNGQGVTKDNDKAFEYTETAALGGHAISQYNLGVYYANGTGTTKNPVQALAWFLVAKDTDPSTDNGSIENFKKGLGAAKVQQAEQRAKRYMKK